MANTAEFHLKVVIGDLAVRLAQVIAENDALREELDALKSQKKESKRG